MGLQSDPYSTFPLEIGRVAIHDDGDKRHLSIILNVHDKSCDAIFFTSNSLWSFCRKATNEELAMVGFVTKRKTYLAWVNRSINEFYGKDILISSEQLKRLKKPKFFKKPNNYFAD